jgi:hypothetical protein
VMINRALVLTMWAAVVAEMLGFDYDEALTLGRAVAGLNSYAIPMLFQCYFQWFHWFSLKKRVRNPENLILKRVVNKPIL